MDDWGGGEEGRRLQDDETEGIDVGRSEVSDLLRFGARPHPLPPRPRPVSARGETPAGEGAPGGPEQRRRRGRDRIRQDKMAKMEASRRGLQAPPHLPHQLVA